MGDGREVAYVMPDAPDLPPMEAGVTQEAVPFVQQAFIDASTNEEGADGTIEDAPDLTEEEAVQVGAMPEELPFRRGVTKKLDGYLGYLSAEWQIGKQDLEDGLAYGSMAIMGTNEKELAEVEQHLKEARAYAKGLQESVSMFEADNFWVPTKPKQTGAGLGWREHSQNFITRSIQEMPGAVVKNFMFGAGVGAATIAGTPIAGFYVASHIMGGQALRDAYLSGVPFDKARPLAILSGLIQGVIETFQVGRWLRRGKRAFKAQLIDPEFKRTVTGVILRHNVDVLHNSNQELTQEYTQIVFEFLEKLPEGEIRLPTTKEWAVANARAGKAWVEGGKVGHATSILSSTTGATLGGAAKIYEKAKEKALKKKLDEEAEQAEQEPTLTTHAEALTEEIKEIQKPGSTEETVGTPKGDAMRANEAGHVSAMKDSMKHLPLQGKVELTETESKSTKIAKEKHAEAKEVSIKARQHLETVQYEKDQLAPGDEVTKDLAQRLKDAHKDKNLAVAKEKVLALQVAKMEAQDVLDSKDDATEEAKNVARAAVDKIAEKQKEANDKIAADAKSEIRKTLTGQIEVLNRELQAAPAHDKTDKKSTAEIVKTPEYKQIYDELAQANPTWGLKQLQDATFKEYDKRHPPKIVDNKNTEYTQEVSKKLNDAQWRLRLLDSGLLSPKLEQSLVDSERNQMLKSSVAELAQKAFAQVWKIAKSSKDIANEKGLRDRKLLATLIKKSGLTTAEQGQLSHFLTKGVITSTLNKKTGLDTTVAKLDRRIKAIAAKRDRKIAKDRLSDIVNNAKETVVPKEKAESKGRADAILAAYKRIGKWKPDEVNQYIQHIEDKIVALGDKEQPLAAPDEVTLFMELQIANDVAVANDKSSTAEDINAIADKLEAMVNQGKIDQFNTQELDKARKALAADATRRAIRGSVRMKKHLQHLNDVQRFFVMWKRGVGPLQGMFNLHSANMAILLQHASKADYKAMMEMLSLDKEGRQARANTSRFITKMFDFILVKEGEFKRDPHLKDVLVRGSRKQNYAGFGDPISANELIQVRIQCQDKSLASRIQATYHESQEELLERVEDLLTADQIYLSEKLKEFYQEYYKRINAHHIEVFGYSLKHNPQYSGRAVGSDGGESPYSDFLLAIEHNRSQSPGSLKARLPNQNDLEVIDAFSNAISHIQIMEKWRSCSKKIALLESLFNNKDVKKDMDNKFGKAFRIRAQHHYQRIVGLKTINRTDLDKYLGWVRGNFGMYMAGNYMQYLKQGTGIGIWLNYMSVYELVDGFNDYIDNFEEANTKLQATDFMLDRRHNVTPEAKAMVQGQSQLTSDMTLMDKLKEIARLRFDRIDVSADLTDILLLPVTQPDLGVNSIGMWAMRKKELAALVKEKNGMTQEQMEAEAMARAERAADESQSSSGEHQKTVLETQLGAWGQLGSALSKQNVQTSNLTTIEWRRMLSDPSPANIYKAIRTSMVLNASQAAFASVGAAAGILNAMYAPSADDDEERKKKVNAKINAASAEFAENTIAGSFLGVPAIGQVSKAAMTASLNAMYPLLMAGKKLDAPVFDMSLPGFETANDALHIYTKYSEDAFSSVPLSRTDYGNLATGFLSTGGVLMTPPKLRPILGLNPAFKNIVWLDSNPTEQKAREKARRKGEAFDEPHPDDDTSITDPPAATEDADNDSND